MRAILGLLWAMAALLCGQAWADSWMPPSTRDYVSEDGQWRLTVVPRGITSPLRYFEDKVAGRPNPGARPGSAPQPLGQLEHQVQGQWQVVWQAPLVNETAPVDAIVSAQGIAVTFDNWHSMGHGSDVVVIYDAMGRKVRALGLEDFLPKAYVHALPRSVSSIHWGSRHSFSPDGQTLMLRVVVPQKEDSFSASTPPDDVQVRLETATGRVVPPEGPEWDRAMAAARAVTAERVAMLDKEFEAFKLPLVAPSSGDEGDWHRYLVEAYLRLAQGPDPAYPRLGFVAAGRSKSSERDQRLVRNVLQAAREEERASVVLGCPDPAQLLRVLNKVVAQLPANGLRRASVYVAVTPALRDAAARALAPTGAVFIALDISAPIPQSPQRLEQFSQLIAAMR